MTMTSLTKETPAGGRLILVPTPIGNLGDMTLRAIKAFQEADAVCCEDTRVTGKLLAANNISKRLERLDEASISAKGPAVIQRVLAGEVIAYASDAGMPGVSDPGARLVALAREAEATVEVLPGPSAAATAYVASGFICPRYYFGGFFPRKAGERMSLLTSLKSLDATLVFYESPNRIASALTSVAEAMPTRNVAVCRELTKLHEEIYSGKAPEVAAEFIAREAVGAIKGEIVLVIDAPGEAETAAEAQDAEAAAALRTQELKSQGMSAKDIRGALMKEFGLPRNVAYEIALQ